jgi:hypothetical protein
MREGCIVTKNIVAKRPPAGKASMIGAQTGYEIE